MRVVFIGASNFGLRCLDAIAGLDEIEIVGIVTNQESFKISYSQDKIKNYLHADFENWASTHLVPLYMMKDNMNEADLRSWLLQTKPDLQLVVGWYHMVPNVLRKMAPAIGLHASLLPDYSGGAPLVWAMINGEIETGITLFRLESGIDNGPIFGQAITEIKPDDTIATLYARIEELGIELLQKYLPRIARNDAVPKEQDESKRRIFPQRNPDDGLIDWSDSGENIFNFVRAQTKPYPGAFSYLHGKKITILSCKNIGRQPMPEKTSVGSIDYDQETQVVCVRVGNCEAVELVSIQVDGSEMSAASFFASQVLGENLKFDGVD